MTVTYPQIDRRERLSAREFRRQFVDRRPVVITGVAEHWPAVTRWTFEFLREVAGSMIVKVRPGAAAGGETERMRLDAYLDVIEAYERDREAGGVDDADRPPYLHDTPMLGPLSTLLADVTSFPAGLLPGWYGRDWERFALLFVGVNSLTPLHFDTQETHNLFFQIAGSKRFIVVPPGQRRGCYPRDWRWSPVDAESPDLDRFPRFGDVTPAECTLGPGEILYMPSRAFHQVRGPGPTISFNIDWHTRRSVIRGLLALARGMPLRYVASNALHAIGLSAGFPARRLDGLYRRHLDSVD